MYLFTHAVRLLHYDLRVPIVPAIAAAALGYCGLGAVSAPLLPESDWFFWASAASCLPPCSRCCRWRRRFTPWCRLREWF
jgi:hypothetical protein